MDILAVISSSRMHVRAGTHMNVTTHMRLDPFDRRHLPQCFLLSPILPHAGVSLETLGAQSLVGGDLSPDVHHDSDPRHDIDPGHSAVYDNNADDRSISPVTTGNPHHSSHYQPLLVPLFHLQLDIQLTLFAAWNRVLSLW